MKGKSTVILEIPTGVIFNINNRIGMQAKVEIIIFKVMGDLCAV